MSLLGTMEMNFGDALTHWSVRLAIGCYLARAFLDLRSGRPFGFGGYRTKARWFWTCGCALYVVHVVSAFGFFHDWSHALAYRHTAEQTAAVTGIRWGGGLYVNYLFTAYWLLDVAAWWCRGVHGPYRSPVYFCTLHAVFAFMVINSTVVFGPPVWTWIALAVLVLGVLVRSQPANVGRNRTRS